MSRQHFMSKDLDLLESGLFADATITCGDRTWKVHRSIICRCEWFKKAFSGKFKEAQTNNVSISAEDFSPETVDCAITFIYSGVADIGNVDTNHSMPDACVRLWVIADFLVLKELQNEAISILEKYCDEMVKALCPFTGCAHGQNDGFAFSLPNCEPLIPEFFRGVEAAYAQYPHSVPCQQVLINFFYAVRVTVFCETSFILAMSKAPHQFSHELFIATIEGRVSKWTPEKLSDFYYWRRQGNCTYCRAPVDKHTKSASIDPSMSGLSKDDRALNVSWRCTQCFEKHGLERVPADEERR